MGRPIKPLEATKQQRDELERMVNGLWAAVSEQLQEDPKGGAVFCFINGTRPAECLVDGA